MKAGRIKGMYEDRGKIFTKNLVKGRSVYDERLIKYKNFEYRSWDPKRSKLAAAMLKNALLPDFKDNFVWLYLGCATGTTVSHVSDMTPKGLIYAVDFAPRVMRDFIFMAEDRKNVVPIMADAYHPERYEARISLADVLFQDIAQKTQVEIFLRNLRFLKTNGTAILALKARSIDVTKKPRKVFEEVRKQLEKKIKILDFKTLEPFEADHAVFVCRKE